eukprot:scaffold14397_cov80-Skeletonema_menzelii.AAC.1
MNNLAVSLTRRGRNTIRVRVIGVHSGAWGEMAAQWGASVECVVGRGGNGLNTLYQYMNLISLEEARRLPPHGKFPGVVFSTIRHEEDARTVRELLELWRPSIAIASMPEGWGRLKANRALKVGENAKKLYVKVTHQEVGGVTVGAWRIWYRCTLGGTGDGEVYATAPFTRTLQTSLDDTLGIAYPQPELNKDGDVIDPRSGKVRECYYAGGLGPDISKLKPEDRTFWVKAKSVRRKRKCVLRTVTAAELSSLWDYETKLEVKSFGKETARALFHARLESPPGKILRTFGHPAFEKIQRGWAKTVNLDEKAEQWDSRGLTKDIKVGSLEKMIEGRVEAKLPDDAPVDYSLWALPNETPAEEEARHILRRVAVKWWAANIESEARAWLETHAHDERDVEAVENVIRRVKAASYWEWHRGSRLFFWRFPSEFRDDARDGVEFFKFFKGDTLPTGLFPNIPSESREAELATRKKIFKLWRRWYLEEGPVKLVIPRFSIVKAMEGDVVTDIRVIWDCKANGHNKGLWAPGFMLPGADDAENMIVKWLDRPMASYLDDVDCEVDYGQDESVYTKSVQFDIDVGEMFYNYTTHWKDRMYLGARLITTRPPGVREEEKFVRFTGLPFGGRCCPFNACQGQTRILELCEGDRHDKENPFQWEEVRLNLPTSERYDPSLPRVLRIREDGELATMQSTYVDDIRGAARDSPDQPNNSREAARRLKRKMNYYGNQADERKFRPPALNPGAWRGFIFSTGSPFPMKSTTAKKWTRFKDGLRWIIEKAGTVEFVETAELRRIAGLGVHITEMYTDARCYLKGFFNALEAFRSDRDVDGWRLQTVMDQAAELEDNDASTVEAVADYPVLTKITPELLTHAQALLTLFHAEEPLTLPIRPSHRKKIRYFIGDASAEGLGSASLDPGHGLVGREGLWKEDFAAGGSNLREAQCQVNHLLAEIEAGVHDGCEIWAFSDNAIWSMVFTKGSSSAKHLFDLVLALKVACHEHEVYLHTCHISGDRMIATGIDGWSRGDRDAGISLGYDLRDFLPLDKPAFEWPGQDLETWCKGWMGSEYSPPLRAEGWYREGHLPGVHIWAPPPAAALEALKQISKSRLKRMDRVTHVFICPRLLYQEEWRRRFEKEMDIWFFLNPGSVWTNTCFEPLIVGICFPLNRQQYPWLLRQERDKVVEIGRGLSELSKTSHIQVRNYLRQLWASPRTFPRVP